MKTLIDSIMNGDSEKMNYEINKYTLPIKFYALLIIILLLICLISNYYIYKNINILLKE